MDELFYLITLIAGITGGLILWRYSRTKKQAVAQAIRKQKDREE